MSSGRCGSLRESFPKSELHSTTFAYVSYIARYTKGSDSLRVLFRGTTITATTTSTATTPTTTTTTTSTTTTTIMRYVRRFVTKCSWNNSRLSAPGLVWQISPRNGLFRRHTWPPTRPQRLFPDSMRCDVGPAPHSTKNGVATWLMQQ